MNGFGASLHHEGVTFHVWAPRCRSVEVVIEGRRPQPMAPLDDGVFELTLGRLGAGTRYQYRSEEHTSELQSLAYLVCRLLLEKKKKKLNQTRTQDQPVPALTNRYRGTCRRTHAAKATRLS